MRQSRRFTVVACAAAVTALLASGGLAEAATADSIVGTWLTKGGKSHVEIDKCGDALCGKIVWLKAEADGSGKKILDKENKDAALRSRPLLGLEMMTGFQKTGTNEWGDGKLYNPEDGKTYEPTLTLNGNGELEVKGCVLFICETHAWTRVKK